MNQQFAVIFSLKCKKTTKKNIKGRLTNTDTKKCLPYILEGKNCYSTITIQKSLQNKIKMMVTDVDKAFFLLLKFSVIWY